MPQLAVLPAVVLVVLGVAWLTDVTLHRLRGRKGAR